ncbi:MAG: helix-turn-helix domain-containing protein [Anaerolineae bacterium]|nr:helix-turn-helix domain-containing protein [Anaerolineae bacterium]NUQ07167.1 helix-turn-helix domain-containing protein [Anaerolineae bacterium]
MIAIAAAAMFYSDRLVLASLKALLNERGAKISQSEIEKHSGVSLRTVKRALDRLERLGTIRRTWEPGIGYTYIMET